MWCLVVVFFALPAHAYGDSWINNPAARRDALAKKPVTPRLFTVNLDLPPQERWTSVYSDPLFRNASEDVREYLASNVPKWTVPILESIAADLKGHFHDYADEMLGIAKTLNASIGDIVLVNLVYTLEGIANGDCTMRNTTGPCLPSNGPGLCTSFIAEASNGIIWHGRNLDWNLPPKLRKYIFDANFVRGGRTLFRATTVAGLVGVMHGQRLGGFSVSLDARDAGGNTLTNILKWLVTTKARTASHLAREALQTQLDFDGSVHILANTPMVEPVYYIVGGAGARQGAVVSRDRSPPARDIWFLNDTAANHSSWFMLQTNYDHWELPPKWDDRRTPGIAHVEALGQAGVKESGIGQVLAQWPTMNNHTDVSCVMASALGNYRSSVWLDSVAARLAEPSSLVI